MSTAVAPPPASPSTAQRRTNGGGAPSRRAIRRWAWRMLRREWRQQVLVVALLTVAVAATVVGLGLVVNVQSTNQSVFGSADARVDIGISSRHGVAVDVADARQRFGTVEAIVHENVPVPGSVTPVDLRAQDPHGSFGSAMVGLVAGHYPRGAGQAAVTRAVATTVDLRLGSMWRVPGGSLRVVGIVENPKDLQDPFGLVAPGSVALPSSVTLLFNASRTGTLHYRPPAGAVQSIMASEVQSAKQQRAQALAVLLLATIGLSFVGLLSVAGFTVLANRRMRAIGMIAAIGATDRQVRAVVLANGAAVGAVGAMLGTTLGLAGWFALTPAFERVVGHRYDVLDLPWWAVVAAAILAVVTAIVASWWPGRAAARLPIVVALSGRPAPPQPAHRFALVGAASTALGLIALGTAHNAHPALIVAGILATTAGMLLLAPLGIRALATLAGRAPVAVRLALRDLARYQARSGAALAAASLAVGIAATIAVTAAAKQAHDHALTGGNLPGNQLIVWLHDPNQQTGAGLSVVPAGGATTEPSVPPEALVTRARSTAEAIAQTMGSSTVVELDNAVDLATPVPVGAPPDASQATLVHQISDQGGRSGWTQVATPYVATPAVLRLYGLTADVRAGADILSSRSDLGNADLGSGFTGDFRHVQVQVSPSLPKYTSAPNTLITTKAMTAGRYSAVPVGWLVQAPHTITSVEVTEARRRAALAGVAVETRTAPDRSIQELRDYSTLAGVLVALGVLAMTVGLIRSETAGDLRTLAAAGASSATRRTVNAASAAALGLLGGLLGTVAAYLALIAWHWHHVDYLDSPPYGNLAAMIVGLPLVAAAGAWLLGRDPRSLSRRPLE